MMDELREFFLQVLNEDLIQITLSGTRDRKRAEKVKVRPVLLKGTLSFQETLYRETKVYHVNYEKEEAVEKLLEYIKTLFRQAQVAALGEEATVLVSKKGAVSLKRRRKEVQQETGERDLAHNRARRYILPEGEPVDFLVGLGVQTPQGQVVRSKYDKFRQINRYLEFIEDILDKLPSGRQVRIIDFGCGKSYLTFAMYYYLHQVQRRDIRVTGLDLKADVIARCSALAAELGYEGLDFQVGDIGSWQEEGGVDMVVSLHACDRATDYALEKAVKWGAAVVMAVPCCQHELNGQIHCDTLQPLLKYGLLKERMAALVTDALRAEMLEQRGYDTQIVEFIDMEHTPKNLMIRAVKSSRMRPGTSGAGLDRMAEFLHVNPALKELL
jgi:SAM-dependent methyltransferase